MYSLHKAAVMIEGHDYGIRRVATRNDGDIGIFNHLVDDSP